MNIKPWQVFIFTLVPLALVFAGVVGGSMHGIDSDKEVFAQAAAAPTASSSPAASGSPAASSPTAGVKLTITAKDLKFDKAKMEAPANTSITVELTNNDAGVLHNIAFYRNSAMTQQLAGSAGIGPLFAGVDTQSFSFKTPAKGNYFFRCDVHPDTMKGAFEVK